MFCEVFSPEVALYLCESTIQPCMEYCCLVWAGAFRYYLELLDKLQKRICRTVGPFLAPSVELLAHRQHVASLSLFDSYYFGILITILVIMFWHFLIISLRSESPQVKRYLISSITNLVHELPHEFPNDFRLRILGN